MKFYSMITVVLGLVIANNSFAWPSCKITNDTPFRAEAAVNFAGAPVFCTNEKNITILPGETAVIKRGSCLITKITATVYEGESNIFISGRSYKEHGEGSRTTPVKATPYTSSGTGKSEFHISGPFRGTRILREDKAGNKIYESSYRVSHTAQ